MASRSQSNIREMKLAAPVLPFPFAFPAPCSREMDTLSSFLNEEHTYSLPACEDMDNLLHSVMPRALVKNAGDSIISGLAMVLDAHHTAPQTVEVSLIVCSSCSAVQVPVPCSTLGLSALLPFCAVLDTSPVQGTTCHLAEERICQEQRKCWGRCVRSCMGHRSVTCVAYGE